MNLEWKKNTEKEKSFWSVEEKGDEAMFLPFIHDLDFMNKHEPLSELLFLFVKSKALQ